MPSFKMKFLGVTILRGVEFSIFPIDFEWALQQCRATALPVILLPLVLLLPLGLPLRTIAWTVSSELLGFCFYFSLFFVSVLCARLNWPSRQLLSACYCTVSYHIVSYWL